MKRDARRSYVGVAAGAAFAATLLIGLMFYGGYWTLPGLTGNAYTVSAFVPDGANVAVNAHVMIAGLQVGRVTGVRIDGPDAVLGLRFDTGPTPLAENSRVVVRLRSLLGETYVEVHPGNSPQRVRSGGSLGLAEADPFVDVDQILQALSGATEGAARATVQSAGAALQDRSAQLNDVLGSGASLLSDLQPLTSTLAAQRAAVSDLVANLGVMMDAIGQRTTALEQFAQGARTTFEAIANRDSALRDTLHRLPALVGALRDVSRTVSHVSGHIAPVLDNAAVALDELSPAIELLRPAAQRGTEVVDALGRAALPLRGVLEHLVKLEPPTGAAMPAVGATLCQLNPMLRYLAPYGPDMAAFFQNFGSAGNAYDASGHAARGFAVVGPEEAGGAFSEQMGQALDFLENLGLVGKLNQNGYDPIPKPGQINKTTVGEGALGPVQAGRLIKYPHVVADC